MAVLYWLKHPAKGFARLRYWLWEKRNPDKPWMCPGTVAFCEKALTKQMTAIEFGSGRSTSWFAQKVGHLISIESHVEWHQTVQQQLVSAGITNVDYRHVALNHPHNAAEQPSYDPLPDYVAVVDQLPDQSLGFAVVDGHYRTTCVRHLLRKMVPGGYLLVDDANRWPTLADLPIPSDWPIVDDSTNGVKRCVIWQKPGASS